MAVVTRMGRGERSTARDSSGGAALLALLLATPTLVALQDGASSRELAPGLAGALEAVETLYEPAQAMALLSAIDPYYRVRGNEGYKASLEAVFAHLEDAGFEAGDASDGGGEAVDTMEFRDFGPAEPAWTPQSARLEVYSPDVGVLHSFEDERGRERTFLCVNSFPTPAQGVVAPVVRFEHSKPLRIYAGAIVYGELPAASLFRLAVQQGGALGVISSYLPEYNRPDENPDAIHFSSVPFDGERRGFGLNLSPAKTTVLDRLLASGPVYLRVTIQARFADSRGRTLVANIAGTDPKAGTVALVAHLDEPGANDNGSGVASMAVMASSYRRAITEGRLPRPRRSVTFLWGTEFECSREWLKVHPGNVDMALVIDMVGQDAKSTGAVPLIERMPDPGAIWDRPPLDVHSEWGRDDSLRESDLAGSYLNDYVMAAMNMRKEATGWPVRSNPFEGGSDHESFLDRGIPAVLVWHFTDIHYHTSEDRLDKVSPDELLDGAIPVLGLVHHFALEAPGTADEVLRLVLAAARQRLGTAAAQAREYLAVTAVAEDDVQRSAVGARERDIVLAWSRWYREALLSVTDIVTDAASPERATIEERVEAALAELRTMEREILAEI